MPRKLAFSGRVTCADSRDRADRRLLRSLAVSSGTAVRSLRSAGTAARVTALSLLVKKGREVGLRLVSGAAADSTTDTHALQLRADGRGSNDVGDGVIDTLRRAVSRNPRRSDAAAHKISNSNSRGLRAPPPSAPRARRSAHARRRSRRSVSRASAPAPRRAPHSAQRTPQAPSRTASTTMPARKGASAAATAPAAASAVAEEPALAADTSGAEAESGKPKALATRIGTRRARRLALASCTALSD